MGSRRGRQKVAPIKQTYTGAFLDVYLYVFFDCAFYVSLNHSSHDVGLACALRSCFPIWRAPEFGVNDARLCSWDNSLQPRSLAAQRCSLTSTSKTCFSSIQYYACLIGLGGTQLVTPDPSNPNSCSTSLSTALAPLTLHKKSHLLRHCFPVLSPTLHSSPSALRITTTAVKTASLLSVLPAGATNYF